jgi:hypothetical protein
MGLKIPSSKGRAGSIPAPRTTLLPIVEANAWLSPPSSPETRLPSLLEVATELSKGQGYSQIDLKVLAAATENDFLELFKTDHGDNLSRVVKQILAFSGTQGSEEIGDRARQALIRIGRESKINAIRVKIRHRSR